MAREHIYSLDAVRVLATIGIVWFHADPGANGWANAGLPAFLALTGFGIARSTHKPFDGYVLERARRLLVPWVFWYGVYMLERVAVKRDVRAALPSYTPLGLLHGPAIHLWYLPFAFVASAFVGAALRRTSVMARALPGLGIGVGLLFALPRLSLPPPLSQWWYSLPAVAIGVVLAESSEPRVLGFAAVGLAVASAVLWESMPIEAVQYALGVGMVLIALGIRVPRSRALEVAASLTLGVYLVHPAISSVCYSLGHGGVVERFAAGVIGGGVITAVLQRFALGRLIT